jgi:hypothetical protein
LTIGRLKLNKKEIQHYETQITTRIGLFDRSHSQPVLRQLGLAGQASFQAESQTTWLGNPVEV